MTSHDSGGDGDDDPQLKSLRAVWLSMPDEEPPERGLAELMAAARVKAEQMAKPSLWQRISALLRRPPVLALATVMILIGGAVFIGKRSSKMDATPEAVQEQATNTVAPSAGSAAGEGDMDGVAAPAGATGAAQAVPADETIAPEPMPEKKEEAKTEPPRVTRAPVKNADKGGLSKDNERAGTKTTTKPPTTKVQDSKAPTAQRGRDDSMLLEGGLDDGPSTSDRFASPPPPPPAPAAPTAPAEAPTATSEAVVGGAPKADSQPSRAVQYVQQAKSAAARGDCAVARQLMKRVAGEDAAAYRKALATDAALKKCFE